MAYVDRSDDDCGFIMKQESVISLYDPTPMSPTSTKTDSHLSAQGYQTSNGSVNASKAEVKRNVSYGNLTDQHEAKVLVLYTGKMKRCGLKCWEDFLKFKTKKRTCINFDWKN